MGRTSLGPVSVWSSKLFSLGPNDFLKDHLFNTGPLSTLSHVSILSPIYSVLCLFSLLILASLGCVSAWTLRFWWRTAWTLYSLKENPSLHRARELINGSQLQGLLVVQNSLVFLLLPCCPFTLGFKSRLYSIGKKKINF